MAETGLSKFWMKTRDILHGALKVAVGLIAVMSTWTLIVMTFADVQHGVEDVKIHASSNTQSINLLKKKNGEEHKLFQAGITELEKREQRFLAILEIHTKQLDRIETKLDKELQEKGK